MSQEIDNPSAIKIDQQFLQAVQNNDIVAVINCLKKGANINVRDSGGRTALHLAAWYNHINIAVELIQSNVPIDAQNNSKGTALHDAAYQGHVIIVRLLLAKGANVVAMMDDGRNALHWSTNQGQLSVMQLLLEHEPELIQLQDSHGNTPLHVLNLGNTLAAARLLLHFNANINTQNYKGSTALHEAVRLGKGDLAVFLFHKGANINLADKEDFTPLQLNGDQRQKEVVECLHEKIIAREFSAHQRFFDAKRSTKLQTRELADQFHRMRTTPGQKIKSPGKGLKEGEKQPVEMTGVPGRRHVMSDANGLLRTLSTGFYNGGNAKSGKTNKEWAWEYLHFILGLDSGTRDKKTQEILITSSQYQPVQGHIGNFVSKNVGAYGRGEVKKKMAILSVIDQVTKSKVEQERELARLFLDCLKNGSPITSQLLKTHISGFVSYNTKKDRVHLISQLTSILVLTGIKEVVRRMHGSNVNLPIAIAYIQGLRLVADGHLRMSDIFDTNAKFGLPTGNSLATNERAADQAKAKLKALNAYFLTKYPQAQYTREYFHRRLLESYGGASDSEGEEYETSDDEEKKDQKRKAPPTKPVERASVITSIQLPIAWPLETRMVDVPNDNNCLFWSAALGLLLPLLGEQEKSRFNTMFDRLFGTDGLVYILVKDRSTDKKYQRQQIPIQSAREHIRAMLITYDYARQTPREFEGGSLIDLVCNRFRFRVAQKLCEVFRTEEERSAIIQGTGRTWDEYCLDMTRPTAWGGQPEIKAISALALTNVHIYGYPQPQVFTVSEAGSIILHLAHVNAEHEGGGTKNHYNFGYRTSFLVSPALLLLGDESLDDKKTDREKVLASQPVTSLLSLSREASVASSEQQGDTDTHTAASENLHESIGPKQPLAAFTRFTCRPQSSIAPADPTTIIESSTDYKKGNNY